MKALVFGAGGMLGSELLAAAPAGVEVVGITRARCDVTDAAAVRDLARAEGGTIWINATAYTAVDRAEEEPEAAFRANGLAPANLARAAREVGARLLHVGTDFVFDGTARAPYDEYDAPAPRSVYGRSKHWGERAVLESGADAQVVRTQWLYGPRGKHFVGAILKAAAERPFLTVVDDQVGVPTSTRELAPALWRIAREGGPGLWHFAQRGQTSWFGFARELLACAGVATEVRPISTSELARPAERPAYSVLGTRRLQMELGLIPRPWEEALAAYLAEKSELERLRGGGEATEVRSKPDGAGEARSR